MTRRRRAAIAAKRAGCFGETVEARMNAVRPKFRTCPEDGDNCCKTECLSGRCWALSDLADEERAEA